MKIKILCISFIFFLSLNVKGQKSQDNPAKYVFLFIGDGMGIQQVNTAKVFADSVLKSKEGIVFTKFPVASLSTTYAANRYITCSAAAGTALSTGSKTSIGTIGLNATHTDTLFSIAKKFKDNGKKVAILTSVSIDHATPAAFYAHKGSRSSYYEIAKDLFVSNYDFFASGGFKEPLGSKSDTSAVSIYELGSKRGIAFTSSFTGIDSLKEMGKQTIVFSDPNPAKSSTLQYEIDRASTDVKLADITQKAIDVVNNPNGFFMMVEGGKIDWACHDNDAATVIYEVLAFSEAISRAIDFYNQHSNETLIVVTADHETGGMSLGNAQNEYDNHLKILLKQHSSQEKLHDRIATLKKTSPKATFDDILLFLAKETGLSKTGEFALTNDELTNLKSAYVEYFNSDSNGQNTYSATDAISQVALAILSNKAGIGWTSPTHTGSPVPVFVLGQGQELFNVFLDNTEIPKKILESAGIQ
ncbi:MAG: alkaline phosphatase [Bacteroidales bacterium]